MFYVKFRCVAIVFFGCLLWYKPKSQVIAWIDTLKYSSCTGVGLLHPGMSDDMVAFGVLSEDYSAPDLSNRRNFLLSINRKGVFTFLDSSSTGGSTGIITNNSIYKCLRLHSMNKAVPIIGGTLYPEGVYLVRFDPLGNVIWARKQSFHALPNHMIVDRNGLIYVQYSDGNGGFICKYSTNGDMLSCQFPSGSNQCFDASNNFYLTGFMQFRKFDYSGNVLWSEYAPEGAGLAVDDNGECYLSYSNGYFNSTVSRIGTNGNVVWTANMPIECLVSPSIEGENLYVAGNYGSGNTIQGIEVLKLDPSNGSVIWTTKIPSPAYKLAALASTKGHIYMSAQEWGNYSARLSLIEDLSYIPVTTSIPSTQKKTGTLNIAPNPSNGKVRVSYSFEEGTGSEVRVLDALGREVFRSPVNGFAKSSEQTLDLSHLPAGVYLLEINSSGRASDAKRLVIQ